MNFIIYFINTLCFKKILNITCQKFFHCSGCSYEPTRLTERDKCIEFRENCGGVNIDYTSKMVGENCSILPVLDDAAKLTIFLKLLRVM